MEGKKSGSRAGKFRYHRRKRRGTHRRSHSGFSSNARSETFSGCHAGCYRKLCPRRFLGISKLETSADRLCRSLRCRSVGKPSYDPDISQCRPADELPRWLVKLMKYVEKYGAI